MQTVNGSHPRGRHHADPADDSLLQIVWRQRGVILLITILALVLGGAYLLVAPKTYTASATLLVQRALPGLGDHQQAASTSDENDTFLNQEAALIKSPSVLYTALGGPAADGEEDMAIFKGVTHPEAFLKRELNVDVSKKDGLIKISLDAKDADEATKVVENVLDSYKSFKSKQRRDTASGVVSILQKDKDKTDADLSAKEDQILKFKQANNTISFEGDKSNYIIQRANSINDALTQAHLDTINLKTAYQAAAPALDADTLKQVETTGGAVMLSQQDEEMLRAHLFSLREELAERKRTYLPDHPIVKGLEQQIKEINISVVASARLRWMASEQREQELQKSFDDQQKLAMDMAGKAAEFDRLQSDANRLQSHSAELDKQIKDYQLQLDAGALNITVIDPPDYKYEPVKPIATSVLGIAALAGLILGVMGGIAREWLDPRLRDASDVKTTMGVPVLGSIPHFPGASSPEALGWAVHLDPSSEAAEAYRTVRTSLQFGAEGASAKSIVITSPAGRDGKSTLASNLAIAMAKVGKNVILIDADFRSPSLHRIFGVSGEVGFSSVLTAGEMVDRAIRRTTVDRLHVMPAGPSVRNPSELLNSPMLGEMLDELSRTYDHIVIDTPPVARVDDARIVAASTDVTILVLRADKSNRKLAEDARDRLMSVGARITGVVLNDVSGANSGLGGSLGGGLGGFPTGIRGGGSSSGGAGRENESQTPVDDVVSHASVRPVTGSGQVA